MSATDAWSDYWRTGQPASCFSSPGADVTFPEVWREFVAQLRNPTRLIDLATGNGAAARACARQAALADVTLKIDAVDAADISPPHDPQTDQMITFRSRTKLESLPFGDATFGGATSLFGFEYADEDAAASEVVRVLARDASIRLVMHASAGAAVRDVAQRLDRLEQALQPDGPMGLVLALTRAGEARDILRLQSLSGALPAAVAKVQHLARTAPPDDAALFYSRAFLNDWALRAKYDPRSLRHAIESGCRTAAGVATRQRQMLQAARSAPDVERLCERLRQFGVQTVTHSALTGDSGGEQVAWLIAARK